jgi:hypothetical protein
VSHRRFGVYSPGSRQQFRRFGAGRLSTDLFGHGNNLVVGASVDRGPVKFTESSDWALTWARTQSPSF